MTKFFVFVFAAFAVVAAVTGIGFLLAYPTMWLVNYLFSTSFLQFVFGVSALSVWKAWALNVITGVLFKSTSASK